MHEVLKNIAIKCPDEMIKLKKLLRKCSEALEADYGKWDIIRRLHCATIIRVALGNDRKAKELKSKEKYYQIKYDAAEYTSESYLEKGDIH